MRIAVLSDIHANRPALEAVLEDSHDFDVDRYWFLGDAVGYGPDPVAPALWLKRYVEPEDWVIGNHDAMLAGLLRADEWEAVGPSAKMAIGLNRDRLMEHAEAWAYIQAVFNRERIPPREQHLDGVDYVLVHSGQTDHLGIARYIYAWQEELYLQAEFGPLRAQSEEHGGPRAQLYGHTHVPTLVFARARRQDGGLEYDAVRILPGETYKLDGELALVNPGAVGQPRDLDRRAAYAVLDTAERTVTFRRVRYDWQETASALSAWHASLMATLTSEQAWQIIDNLKRRLRDATPYNETPDEWLAHYARAKEWPL